MTPEIKFPRMQRGENDTGLQSNNENEINYDNKQTGAVKDYGKRGAALISILLFLPPR